MTIYIQYSLLQLNRRCLVLKAHQYKTETSTSSCCFVAHNDCIFNFTELHEVAHQVVLGRLECKAAHKQFDLVLFCWLMKLRCRRDHTRHHAWYAKHWVEAAHLESSHAEEGVLKERHHLHLLERVLESKSSLGQAHLHLKSCELIRVRVKRLSLLYLKKTKKLVSNRSKCEAIIRCVHNVSMD